VAVLKLYGRRALGVLLRPVSELQKGERPPVRLLEGHEPTGVESYWTRHTVSPVDLIPARSWTRGMSRRQLEWRFDEYPMFRELTGLWGEHDGEAVLDFGCGPGNDVVGFALHTGAERIIGIDVSATALSLAADRLALHRIDPGRVELIQASDTSVEIPLADESVDHVQSQGVIHHMSDPEAALRELHRVLRPGGTGCVMVYNRDSVWFHLWVAYERMIVEGAFAADSVEEAFRRSTDGDDCPISRCYTGNEFSEMCEGAGFQVEYAGGYLSRHELGRLESVGGEAVDDDRLGLEHREFLRGLETDPRGYPLHRGAHAGIGGTYRLRKQAAL
jgi:ubiquinone/menaquinone biosynthesis C-methylase UbiE